MVSMLDRVIFFSGSQIHVWVASTNRDHTSASMTQHTDGLPVQTTCDIIIVVRVCTHAKILSGLKNYIKNQ